MLYRTLVRPLLFLLPPETAHHLGIVALRVLARFPRLLQALGPRPDPRLGQSLWGKPYDNPIGLAAGFDKDAEVYPALGALGFGSVEVGTVTAQPQPGNPAPRLFRLARDRALINRMGFNNLGAKRAAQRIGASPRHRLRLGINIGKTKVIPPELAAEDYAVSTRLLAPLADYLVVNVSSPNTPGLRDLQAVEALRPLLLRVRKEMDGVCDPRVPLLVKIAPDLSDEEVDAVADLCVEVGIDGVIAINTTVERSGLVSDSSQVAELGAGGLSGPVLRDRSLSVLRRLRERGGERLILVSVGGVETVDDVWQRLSAGASLVQLYTGFIYGGPALPRRLCRGLGQRLRREGMTSIAELIGRDVRSAAGPSVASGEPAKGHTQLGS